MNTTNCKELQTSEWVWGGLEIGLFVFKSPQLLNTYQTFSIFSLYQYQNITYDGSFQRVLNRIQKMDEMMDKMLFSSWIKDVLERKTELSLYNPYTNTKYLQV